MIGDGGKTEKLPPGTFVETPRIPDYEILRCIGEGAYGRVYLARDSLGDYCAIKIVRRSPARDDRHYERELDGLRHFASISRLHEGFVDILHVGRNDPEGYFYYVMELGDASSGAKSIDPAAYSPRTIESELEAKGRLAPAECVRIGVSLSSALAFLHQRNLVHRDIKPANVIFVDGLPKLADPGLITVDLPQVSVVGTPLFMDPLQHGHKLGDIYSLGRVLYVMATGLKVTQFPFLPDPPPEDRRELLELNEVLLRAGASDPSARYRTMEDLLAHLALLQAGESIRTGMRLARWWRSLKRYRMWLAVLAVLGIFSLWEIYRVTRQAVELRERKIGSYLAYGTAAVNARDYLRALPWFTAALEIERDRPERALNHRLRIGATLAASPRLVQLWEGAKHPFDVEFSADGRCVLLSGTKETILTLDIESGRCPTNVPLGEPSFDTVVLSADGHLACTVTETNGACLWNAATGGFLRTLVRGPGVENVAAFAPNSETIAVAVGGSVRLLSCVSGEELLRFAQPCPNIEDLAWNKAGTLLAVATDSNGVIVFEATSGRLTTTFTNHSSWVYSVAFSPQDATVASASFDRTARVWSLGSAQEILRLAHDGAVGCIAFSPDGRQLVTAGMDNQARLFDARTGVEILSPLPHESKVAHVRFSRSGRYLLTTSVQGVVRVWDLDIGQARRTERNLTASASGNRLAWCEASNNVVVANADGVVLQRWIVSGRPVERLRFNVNGRYLLACCQGADPGWTSAASLWDTAAGSLAGATLSIPAQPAQLALSPDGLSLAVIERDNLGVWDTISGELIALDQLPWTNVSCLAWHPSANRLVLGADNVAAVYDISLQRLLWPRPALHSMAVAAVCFSPNGRLLATATADASINPGEAQIHDASTGAPRGPSLRHMDGVRDVAFSENGRWIATGSEDFTAAVWDLSSGRMVGRPLRHPDEVNSVAFAAAHPWLVTGCRNGATRIWDLETSEPLTPPLQFQTSISKARFLADDKVLLAETGDGQTWLWALSFDGRPVEQLRGWARILSAERFGPLSTTEPQAGSSLAEAFAKLKTAR